MVNKVLEMIKAPSGRYHYIFDSGVIATCFSAYHIDAEVNDIGDLERGAEGFFSSLAPGVRVRFKSETVGTHGSPSCYQKRMKDIEYVGRITHNLQVSFEKSLPRLSSISKKVFGQKQLGESLANDFDSLIDENILEELGLEIYPDQIDTSRAENIKASKCGLRVENQFVSVLKLHKLGNNLIDLQDLCVLREQLPLTSEICLLVEKLPESEAQFFLKSKSKQDEGARDLVAHRKYLETQKAIEEIDLMGKSLLKMELTITFKGYNQDALRDRTHEAKRILKSVGEFEVESFGSFENYRSSQIGSKFHINQVEVINRISSYLPIYTRGKSKAPATSNRSFAYHRIDDSIDHIDPFNDHYANYSGLIIGKSGSGKSVFTNTLLGCLLNDPKVSVILVDVRGSHTNTVRKLGGVVSHISASQPSGSSPFDFLRERKDKATVEILLDFLEKILIESDETSLSRAEQVRLEKVLFKYVESDPIKPSIDSFLSFSREIPRRESLERWRKDGLYGNVFSPYQLNKSSRLHYFNFKDIVTAQKGGISTAVMSAIMAHFNFKLLDKKTDEKLVFIADETPFFVKNCFSSFNLLMKNVRKLSGSLILVAQNLSDLEVNGDPSLINQTEFRVFFSKDNASERFKRNSGLSERSLATLEHIRQEQKKFSMFILKDVFGEKIGKLVLSKEEYFRSSTLADDRDRIEKLTQLLSLKDENLAIEILSNLEEQYDVHL